MPHRSGTVLPDFLPSSTILFQTEAREMHLGVFSVSLRQRLPHLKLGKITLFLLCAFTFHHWKFNWLRHYHIWHCTKYYSHGVTE